MSEPPAEDPEKPAITVRLSIRKRMIAQVEGALLAEKIALSDTGIRRRGKDPYNLARTPPDAWARRKR